jgi:hypothetical protein
LLKRLFLGRLVDGPAELDGDNGNEEKLTPIAIDQPAPDYQVIFAVGRLSG